MNCVIKKSESVVNNTLVKMVKALGYDIELYYIKRKKKGKWIFFGNIRADFFSGYRRWDSIFAVQNQYLLEDGWKSKVA